MYEEEGILQTPEEICASILNYNLFGIDIDERAIQISVAALWMHAKARARGLSPEVVTGPRDHLVAANLSLPTGRAHLAQFLSKHPEDAELRPALEAVFQGLADANQLGTLLRIEEPVEQELKHRKEEVDRRAETVLRDGQVGMEFVAEQLVLTQPETRDYEAWKRDLVDRLKLHFRQEATVSDPVQRFFGRDASQCLALFDLTARRYDVIAANPPYMGSKNMGPTLKTYLKQRYEESKRDLYSAFIVRALDLLLPHGRAALQTLHTFLTSRAFADLRRTVLKACRFETAVHLGKGTMKSLSNPNAQGFCMYVLDRSGSDFSSRCGAFVRLVDCNDKQQALDNSIITGSVTP